MVIPDSGTTNYENALFTTSTRTTTVTVSFLNAAAVRGQVVNEAMKHRGARYRYGAAGPSSFDCSGFTQYVYRRFGVRLPRSSRQQRAQGRSVSRTDARPGDLVAFSQGGSWGHVAIYLGSGYIIDAPHSGSTVRVRKMWTNAVAFRRLIG